MIHLFLLRHGKAGKADEDETDYDRQLNKKGNGQIESVGRYLSSEDQNIAQLISSAAVRTKQTSQIVLNHITVDEITYDDKLYLANIDSILKTIKIEAQKNSVIYVGHNFGISDLATFLSGQQIAMSTGMIVHLTFNCEDWNLISKENLEDTSFFTPVVNQ